MDERNRRLPENDLTIFNDIVQVLSIFHDCTLKVSASKNVTSMPPILTFNVEFELQSLLSESKLKTTIGQNLTNRLLTCR